MAGRLGLKLDLDRLNRLSDETPVLVDLKPTGEGYMEDFFAAGGVGGLLQRMGAKFDLSAATVTGETLGDWVLPESAFIDPAVIRPVEDAVSDMGGLVALYGSLAPKGAILKRAAADARLFEKTARAVVFTSLDDLSARIDDPDLDVGPDDALVLQNAGPRPAACRKPATCRSRRSSRRRASRTCCACPTRA